MKNVYITGGNFLNQGAFLMLVAAANGVREHLRAQPVLPLRTGNFRQKTALGIDTLFAEEKVSFFPSFSKIKRDTPISNWLPFMDASKIDAVIDIGGFTFGDQWAAGPIDRRSKQLEWWSQRGIPVYLLPQAFGPFVETAEAGQRAIKSAELVFARDGESFHYVTDLVPHMLGKVHLSPDFTSVVQGIIPTQGEHLRNQVAIIPNWNIYDRAPSDFEKNAYIDNLTSTVSYLNSKGIGAYGLCHEGEKDRHLLGMVKSRKPNFEIVDGLNGLEAKGLLSTARMAVSGRYHAIVSASSKGTPTVMHGWSHKYRHLADDFGSSDLLIDPYAPVDKLMQVIDFALDERVTQETLAHRTSLITTRNEEMWAALNASLN